MSINDTPDVPDARLLLPEVQEFIRAQVSSDVHELSLKQPAQLFGLPFRDIAVQIAGLQTAKHKLPLYFSTQRILYPPPVNLEQCSSEKAATYKARQAAALCFPSNERCVDLTGGFGVDAFFLGREFTELHYVEPDYKLLQLARYNHRQLGALNIFYHYTDALAFLNGTSLRFDLAYVDPSRRTAGNQRRIELTGYSPDIRTLTPFLGKTFKRLVVKASPMLDIDRGLQVVPNVTRIAIVALGSEVRELLFFSDGDNIGGPLLEAVDLSTDRPPFSFRRREESAAEIHYAEPLKYMYEPGPEILKAGAFKLVASRFGLAKLHPNTHFYTSENLVREFPGRTFETVMVTRRLGPELKSLFPKSMANVVVRNYRLTADQLRSRAGLKEGGDRYLLACTCIDGPRLVAAKRLH